MEQSKNVLSTGGLNLDSEPGALQDGEYTYMLNGKLLRKGNSYYANNYNGNTLCLNLPEGYLYNGGCSTLDPDVYVIFLVNPNDKLLDKNNSEIGILDFKTCTYTQKVRSYCLNFQITHQIQATYKESFQCGKTVYFVDNYNPDRNIDLENIPYINNDILQGLDCDTIRIDPIYTYPCISLQAINTGGVLSTGAYQICIQYSDENGTGLTDYTDLTNQIDIIKHFSSYVIAGDPPNTPTSKSIVLGFSNLDQSFTHFNIGVLKTINGIKTAQKIITLPITVTSYTYTGNEPGIQDIDISDLLSRKTIYKHSKTIKDSQGYLLRGNLSGKPEYNLQPYANNIKIQWVSYRVNYQDYLNTYKNELTVNQLMSLMRDEVYPISIRWIYDTGDKTCAYHIPGRKLNTDINGAYINRWNNITPSPLYEDQYGEHVDQNNWDDFVITSLNPDTLNQGNQPRWKVYNTGTINGYTQEYSEYIANGGDPNTYEGCYQYGEMSYWESSLTYPNIPEVWGNLANDKIRHHKMPDCSIINIFDDTDGTFMLDPYIEILGLNVSNINLNTNLFPDLVGYEILIGDRTIQRSIIDKGLLFNNMYHVAGAGEPSNAVTQSPYYYTNWAFNDQDNYTNAGETDTVVNDHFTGYSPNALFNNVNIGSASEIKLESEFYGKAQVYVDAAHAATNIYNGFTTSVNTFQNNSGGEYNRFVNAQHTSVRRSIENAEYILNNSAQITGFGNVNNITRESSIQLNTTVSFNAPTQPDNTKDVVGASPGDEFNISSYYFSLKNNIPNLWGNLENIQYLASGSCIYPISQTSIDCLFLGDTFITKFAIHKRVTNIGNTNMLQITNEYSTGNLDDALVIHAVPVFFVESDINTEYRYNGDNTNQYFYPNLNYGSIPAFTGTSGWLILDQMWIDIDNYYLYNNDYSTLNNSNAICTLLDSFDGEPCPKHYYTRTIYSLKDQTESLVDNWKVFLANNYYDFTRSKGELWDIENLSGDRILFRFTNGVFLRQLNQQLETFNNETTVSIGAGTLFFPEPVELFNIQGGYIGTRSQWAYTSTPFGSFMIDDLRGKVFKFSENFEAISEIKMSTWFNQNLPLNLLKDYPTFPNYDNPNNPDGIGFISTYDPQNKIYIITKRDYEVKDKENPPLMDSNGNFYINTPPNYTYVHLSDPQYFINRSYTISFDVRDDVWNSWHSFIPNAYFQGAFNFNSVINYGNNLSLPSVWTHNSPDTFHKYYRLEYPFIIEFVQKNSDSLITKLDTIYWRSFCYEPSTNNQLYEYKFNTFTKGYIYSDTQSTGNLNFIVKDKNKPIQSSTYPSTGVNATNVLISLDDTIWSLNYLTDKVKDSDNPVPFLTSSWNSTEYQSNFPIDQVIDNASIDYNKSWTQLKPIKNTWSKVRLIYEDTSKILSTQLFFNLKAPSIRKG